MRIIRPGPGTGKKLFNEGRNMSRTRVGSTTLHNSGQRSDGSNRLGQYALLAIAFISGAIVLLLEVLASRILAPYLGSSFSVWVNIIGTILAALSLGYYVGGILADRNQNFLPYIFLAAAAACSFVYLARPLLMSLGALGLIWGSLVAAVLYFAPASAVLGMVTPNLLKLATDDPARIGRTSGGIFAASTLGSIAGTFAGGFWLIPHLPISYILVGIIAVLLGLSLWCAGSVRPYWLLSVVVLLLLGTGMQIFSFSIPHHTIFEKNSRYCNIRVNDIVLKGVPYRFLMLDSTSNAARFLDSPDPALPYIDLSFRLMRSLKPLPGSALVLGGGGYSVPELMKNYSPGTDVVVVEIDPEVTETAKRFFLHDPAIPITTLNEDARVFLNENRRQFDVVYTDVYSGGASVPPSLSSREAFQLIRRATKPDGIAVFNILSAREGEYAGVYQALFRTMREVFPEIVAYTDSPSAPASPQNIIVVASNGKTISEDELPDVLRQFRCRTTPEAGLLLTDDYAPTDYLARSLIRAAYPSWRKVQ